MPQARAIGEATRNDIFAIVADHTGAPRALVNDRKQIVWRASLTGFGELVPDASAVTSLNLRGSNQYYDAESGLYYNHHRYLDPRNGRYLSADPIGIAGGLNLYAFAENNPLANIDPLGLQAKPTGDISHWDTQRRAQYLFLRTGSQIPGVIGDILRELVSPASLATTAAVFTVWAGAQFTPVGPAVDAAIVIAGYFIAGTGAVIAAKELLKAAILIHDAKCEADLQKAADLLAIGMVDALGATAGLAGSAKAMRSERVQGVLRRVFKKSEGGANPAADLAKIRVTLTQAIADLRATLTGSAKTGGNMGIAQIDIQGIQSTMAASSRIATPSAAQKTRGFVGEIPETFPSSSVLTGGSNPILLNRSIDSEAKIINNIAAQLGENTSTAGTINLLTERAPCSSCSNVIEQFKIKYPNIMINLIDNGGVIPPSKKGG